MFWVRLPAGASCPCGRQASLRTVYIAEAMEDPQAESDQRPAFEVWDLSQIASEQVEGQAVAQPGQRRVVARPLVTHEGVLTIEFMPGVQHPGPVQGIVDGATALNRDVRVLPAPDHQQLAPDLAAARQRVGLVA